jgi:hypothetical protein
MHAGNATLLTALALTASLGAPALAQPCTPEWSALGSGMSNDTPLTYLTYVDGLTVFDDGTGLALYASGFFDMAGGVPVVDLARWDGTSWSDPGWYDFEWGATSIFDTVVFDDGSGPALYVGGCFARGPGGVIANNIAKWDGVSWSALGDGVDVMVSALAVFDDDGPGPNPPALYAGGPFQYAGGVLSRAIAKWDGTSWSPLPVQLEPPYGDPVVDALAVFDDGSGPALYVGGWFSAAGGVPLNHVAKWDGATWSALEGGMSMECGYAGILQTHVHALTPFDDGTGAALYVGGAFSQAGSICANFVAKWDASGWSPMPVGEGPWPDSNPTVDALEVFDDGCGPALYAAGHFRQAEGIQVNCVAKWNGTAWSALADGLAHEEEPEIPPHASALMVFDPDGVGPIPAGLYVGGFFTHASGVEVNYIARWGCLAAPGPVGDLDGDDDVDMDDFEIFGGCMGGAGTGYPPECAEADLDDDEDVDLVDFANFQTVFTGPGG